MDETNNPGVKVKAQAFLPSDIKDDRDTKCSNGRLFCHPHSSSSSSASSRSRSTSPPPPSSRSTPTPKRGKKKEHLSTSKGKSDKSQSMEIEEAVEKRKKKAGKHTKHSEHNKHGKRSSSKKKHRSHKIKDGTHTKEDENHEKKKAKSKDKVSSKKKSHHHHRHHHHHHKHNTKKTIKHSKSSRFSKRESNKHRHSRKHHRHHHRSKSSSYSTSSSSSTTSPSVSSSCSSTSSYSSFSLSPSISSSSSSSSYSSPSSSRSLSPIAIRHESRRSRSSRRTSTKPEQSEKDARVFTKEKVLREKKERDLEREILNRQRDRSKSPDACIDGSKELFVGNIDSFVKRSDIEEAFGKYGEVTRIDLRRGFCFVWLKGDACGAKDAFNGTPFGTSKRILRVRWSEKGKDKVFRNNVDPCETLFIANFDPFTTSKEVEDLFSKYGHVVRVSLKRNFGFVQYSDVSGAISAVRNLDGYRFGERDLTVNFVSYPKGQKEEEETPEMRGSPTYSPYEEP